MIGRVLQWLFHVHRWKVLDSVSCTSGSSKWTRYYLQCNDCGEVKVKDPL